MAGRRVPKPQGPIRPGTPDVEERWKQYHDLEAHPGWQEFRDLQIGRFQKIGPGGLGCGGGNLSVAQQELLSICGLSEPKTHEEELRVYLALSSVLRFTQATLGTVAAESLRYKEWKEKT